ncbi:MAG: hypothetical protein WB788_02400 [Thermoplasmata archaeon]|nr:hypothetical protein [Thermoplasmata archaeon]
MTDRREPMVVCVTVVLALSFVLLGLLVSESQACPAFPSSSSPSLHVTAANPVVLPRGGEYSPCSMSFSFSITAPADLHGSWVASGPVAVAVFNTSNTGPNFGWPDPGAYQLNGSLNLTLFPGTYAIEIDSTDVSGRGSILTVTQAFTAEFDRGLSLVQLPFVGNVGASNYSAWPLLFPPGASSVWLEASIATTSCNFVTAILSPSLYQEFQTDRSAIDSPSALSLIHEQLSPCSVGTSNAFPYAALGPLNVSSGDMLVFYNAGGGTSELMVLAPIEVSYLTPA